MTPVTRERPPQWSLTDSLLQLATRDSLVQAAILVAMIGALIPFAGPIGDQDLDFALEVLPKVLLAVVVVGALGRGLGQLHSPDERAFWDDLLLSAGIFAAGLTAQMTGPWTGVEQSTLAGRLLFTVSFAQLLLAVERRPDRSGPWRPRRMERRLALQAVSVLTIGLVVYFAILPRATVDAATSSRAAARIFAALGVLLLLRLLHLGVTAPDRRWRILYRILTITAVGLCLFYLQRLPPFDGLAGAWWTALETATWIVPMVAMVIAARLRHLPFPATWPELHAFADDPEDPVDEIRAGLGTRTLILALAVPLLHHLGYLSGLFDPAHHQAREWWMVLWTLALSVVVFMQRQQLEGRLRRALDDQDRIERTLRGSERRLKLSDVRREADEALFASREKYAKAFRKSPFGLVITTRAEGRHVDCNDRYLEILGRQRHLVIGHTIDDLELFTNPEALDSLRRTLRDHGRVERQVMELQRPDGSYRQLRVSAERLALGDEPCDLAVIEDLTAEQSRRQALRRRSGWIDALDAAVVGLDDEHRVTVWNAFASTLTGVAAEDAVGRPLGELLPLDLPDLESDATWRGPLHAVLPDGRPLHLDAFCCRIDPDHDEATDRLLIVARPA